MFTELHSVTGTQWVDVVCSPPVEVLHFGSFVHRNTRMHAWSSPTLSLCTIQKFLNPAEVSIMKAVQHAICHKAVLGQTSDSRVETKAAVSVA